MAMGKWLGPALDALVAPGGYVLANQPLEVARWQAPARTAGRAGGAVFSVSGRLNLQPLIPLPPLGREE